MLLVRHLVIGGLVSQYVPSLCGQLVQNVLTTALDCRRFFHFRCECAILGASSWLLHYLHVLLHAVGGAVVDRLAVRWSTWGTWYGQHLNCAPWARAIA